MGEKRRTERLKAENGKLNPFYRKTETLKAER
jgi:hypothetical protein